MLQTEAAAVLALADRLDERFVARRGAASATAAAASIVTGMGKSGIVCRKIAATLSSTGTPAFFLHPAEAVHGDLGVIQPDDVVIALSYSGENRGADSPARDAQAAGRAADRHDRRPASTLAQAADVALDCSVSEEACPMNLVPTASTTAALALGDALAMTVLVEKGFQPRRLRRPASRRQARQAARCASSS